MSYSENSKNDTENEFKRFAAKHIIVGILLAVVGLWMLGMVLGFFGESYEATSTKNKHTGKKEATSQHTDIEEDTGHAETASNKHAPDEPVQHPVTDKKDTTSAGHGQGDYPHKTAISKVVGVEFVYASIEPLHYELSERFWGWRPNDILNFTDNITNFQLGVLEVTRRTAEKLAENISRTGSTASFDTNLETARSTCFVIKADEYWFPSAEGKYRDGIKELKKYAEKLENGESSFYTRSDNLIPLLVEYEHLLGSCDDNLVKTKEEDGSDVSFFMADNYFYYAKGVAHAMGRVLEAVMIDFISILETRNGVEPLHHAIESCRHAAHISPWIITDSSMSSQTANHRANMAAHISHARFYIGVLKKTLST